MQSAVINSNMVSLGSFLDQILPILILIFSLHAHASRYLYFSKNAGIIISMPIYTCMITCTCVYCASMPFKI